MEIHPLGTLLALLFVYLLFVLAALLLVEALSLFHILKVRSFAKRVVVAALFGAILMAGVYIYRQASGKKQQKTSGAQTLNRKS